jgi:hypothetical protein
VDVQRYIRKRIHRSVAFAESFHDVLDFYC